MLDTIQDTDQFDLKACWAALRGRDPAADGRFFYGVKTTGVYCRPSCPSRPPRPENVTFYRTQAEAEAAGFRPCKRCRPTERSPVERHRQAVARACALIRAADTAPSLDRLAAAAGMSRYHFHRVFTQIVGTTPGAYARTQRVRRLESELAGGTPVTEAVYAAGFGASSRAYEAAAGGLGMTPGVRRRGGAGQTIRYATAQTGIGWVILAASQRGICAAAFGDDREALIDGLRRRFPAAVLVEDQDELQAWMHAVVGHLAAPAARALDLPLDIQGTAFQARVWQALRKIPLGQTASYAEIAAALGQPAAVRAVARACASNDIALLIPCHRVVRSDGDLAGYRWGVARKRALLAAERRAGGEAEAGAPEGRAPRRVAVG